MGSDVIARDTAEGGFIFAVICEGDELIRPKAIVRAYALWPAQPVARVLNAPYPD